MLDAVLALNETDTQVFDFASQAAPPADAPSDHILVPDAHLLFNGEFKRVGTTDLKIVGDDGASFFIRDYFTSDKASHLISPEGATLSASVVAALAGPLAPGQSAQAGAQQAGQPVIGRVDAMSGSCTVIRNGVSVALNSGDTVRKGDVVQTASGSAVAIVFADGSTFSLNANARMVLDDFVYNAGGTGNSALISLVQGTFSFVAGQVAKTGDMRVDTPVATMGIRGTAVLVEISANDGQTRFSVMTEPDGTTGSFNLYDKTSGSLIGTVNSSQIGWLVTPAGPLQVVAQQVQKTPAQLQQEFNIIQQIFTIFNNNQQNPFVPDQQQDPNRRGDNPNDPNPQTAQGSGGGSGSATGATPSDTSPLTPLQQNQQTNTTVTVTPVSNPPLPDSTQGGGGSDPTNGQDPSQPLPTGQFTIINGSGNITGTEGNDHIFGSGTSDAINALGGDDEVFAGGGNDTIVGGHGEGNDFYDGGDGHDAITFNSANGMTFTLNATNEQSTAVGATTGTDILINIEEIVASPGNDLIILNKASDWTIDAGAGTDTVRLANGLDLDFTTTTGPNAAGNLHLSNFEILDLATDTAQNVIRVDFSDLAGIDNESGMPLRILGGTGGEGGAVDIIEITNLQGLGGKLQLIGTYTDPVDAGVSDPFKDHATDGVTFDVYRYVVDGIVVNTFYVEHGVQVLAPNHAPQAGNVALEANVLGNGGFESAQDFEGWQVNTDTSLPYESYSQVFIDRSGEIFEGDDAVAVLRFSGQVENAGGTGEGPSITSDVFSGNTGDTIRFVYQLSAGTNSGSGDLGTVTGYIIDAETGQIIQEIYNSAELGQSTGMVTVNVALEYSGEFKIKFVVGSIDSTFGYVVGAQLDLGYAGIIRTGVSEDTPFTFSESAFLANSTDSDGDALSVASVSSAHGAVVTINEDGSITYDARTSAAIQALGDGESLTDTITFTVKDEHGNVSSSATATVVVQGVNDAPVVAHAIADTGLTAGSEFSFAFASNTFTDVDDAALVYSATLANGKPLPEWLHFDAVNRTFYGTAPDGTDTVSVTVKASDGSLHTSDTFDIAINAAPNETSTISIDVAPDHSFNVDSALFALATVSLPEGVEGNSLLLTSEFSSLSFEIELNENGTTFDSIHVFDSTRSETPSLVATWSGYQTPLTDLLQAINSAQHEDSGPLASFFAGFQYNQTGGNQADVLRGGNLNDTLSGGAGSDDLYASPGHDTMTGGADHDFFVFTFNGTTASGQTVITDFHEGTSPQDFSPTTDTIVFVNSEYSKFSDLNISYDEAAHTALITLSDDQTILLQNIQQHLTGQGFIFQNN